MLIKPNMFRILASSYQDLNSETAYYCSINPLQNCTFIIFLKHTQLPFKNSSPISGAVPSIFIISLSD